MGKELSKKETMGFLDSLSVNMNKAELMSDEELAVALIHDVWGNLPMDSMQSALLGEAIKRIGGSTI